jgi:hypothetical protein
MVVFVVEIENVAQTDFVAFVAKGIEHVDYDVQAEIVDFPAERFY